MSENGAWRRKIYNLRICWCRQNVLSLDPPNTYKYMRRQWILIGQSILQTIRTIGDKKCPSRGGRNRTRTCVESRPVTAGTVINGLTCAYPCNCDTLSVPSHRTRAHAFTFFPVFPWRVTNVCLGELKYYRACQF